VSQACFIHNDAGLTERKLVQLQGLNWTSEQEGARQSKAQIGKVSCVLCAREKITAIENDTRIWNVFILHNSARSF
jgi:hypothetical protein